MYYTYNYKSQKWNSSKNDTFFPLFTPFSLKEKKALCSTHKQWEACNKISIPQSVINDIQKNYFYRLLLAPAFTDITPAGSIGYFFQFFRRKFY